MRKWRYFDNNRYGEFEAGRSSRWHIVIHFCLRIIDGCTDVRDANERRIAASNGNLVSSIPPRVVHVGFYVATRYFVQPTFGLASPFSSSITGKWSARAKCRATFPRFPALMTPREALRFARGLNKRSSKRPDFALRKLRRRPAGILDSSESVSPLIDIPKPCDCWISLKNYKASDI